MDNIKIDFSDLERDRIFRADYQTYLLLINRYCVSIFWGAFQKRKKLYDMVEAYDAGLRLKNCRKDQKPEDAKGMDKPLFRSLVPRQNENRSKHLDCFKQDFVIFLRDGLQRHQQAALERRLRYDHAIPLRFDAFCVHLDRLRKKRHYLKYWEKQKDKPQKVPDGDIVHSLGLFLLPKLHQHFLETISRHRRRLNISGQSSDPALVRAALSHGRRLRREETERLYSDHGSRKNLNKKERKDREESKQAWMAKYDSFYPKGVWPRYNYHRFKTRYFFIGKAAMGAIERALRQAAPDNQSGMHFEWEIEAVYDAMMRVNERLWRAFLLLDGAKKALPGNKRKAVKMTGRLQQIFNGISHNEPFFAIYEGGEILPVECVFAEVMRAFQADHVVRLYGDPKVLAGDLYSELRAFFGKQNFSFAIPKGDGGLQQKPPHVVRRWTKDKRKTYLNENVWAINKRVRVKKLIASWRLALDRAFKEIRVEEGGRRHHQILTISPKDATEHVAIK